MTRSQHLYTILAEECAEVAQRVTKLLRFGVNEVQPGQDLDNLERLAGEINDLESTINLLREEFLLPFASATAQAAKREKIWKYLAYSESIGEVHKA